MATTLDVSTQAGTWVLASCDDSVLGHCLLENIAPLLAATNDEFIFSG